MAKAKVIVDACCHKPNSNVSGSSGRGKCACGVLILDERGNEFEFSKYLGEMTPPEAEFNGLVFALDQAAGVTRFDIEVLMDSELVVNWMTGSYRMRKEHIRPLFDQAKKNEQRFRSVEYSHHSRSTPLGMRADKLADVEYKKYHP
jgi:ribonuclease HI